MEARMKRFAIVAACDSDVLRVVFWSDRCWHKRAGPVSASIRLRAKSRRPAATFLLDGALQLAENGSWEHASPSAAPATSAVTRPRGRKSWTKSRQAEASKAAQPGSAWAARAPCLSQANGRRLPAAFDKALAMKSGHDWDDRLRRFGHLVARIGRRPHSLSEQAMKNLGASSGTGSEAGGSYLGVSTAVGRAMTT